jgi:cytochrome c553
MRKIGKIGILAFLLALLLIFLPTSSGTPEYGAKESRNCPFCHVSGDYTRLNERGKYYLQHNHSFEGYVEKPREVKSRGEELYVQYCEGCHGKKGENFNVGGNGAAAKDAVKSGRMPPGSPLSLSEKELNELAAYIDSLSGQPTQSVATPGAPGAEKEYKELGIHMPTWNVGGAVVVIILAMLLIVRYWRL